MITEIIIAVISLIEHAEGLISEQDYAETKVLRQSWRDEINCLENEIQADV